MNAFPRCQSVGTINKTPQDFSERRIGIAHRHPSLSNSYCGFHSCSTHPTLAYYLKRDNGREDIALHIHQPQDNGRVDTRCDLHPARLSDLACPNRAASDT